MKNSSPRISIVIPTYNSEPYLAETLDSVCAQTRTDWELIVYDDGSRDLTVSVARAFEQRDARVRVIEGANGGVANARNRGFQATSAGTEYVIFLDNDDVWEPDTLQSLVAPLDGHPEYVSAHCTAISIDGNGQQPPGDDLEKHLGTRLGIGPDGVVARPSSEPTRFAELANSNWPVTPGVHLVRRRVLEAVGGFDPAAVPCDDWDMNVRVSRCGDIAFVDRPLLRWRRHAGAQSYHSAGWRRGYFYVRRKMLADPSNTADQARAARAGFAMVRRGSLLDTRRLVRQRQLAAAARRLAGAALELVEYSRALVALGIRRLRR
jgi:glycosyltransferase involved in cell wall biosynthesis